MTIYCPTCNRSSEQAAFVGEFCEFCISDKLRRKLPEMIRVYQCRFCKKIKVVNTFEEDGERSLQRAVAVATKLDCKVKILEQRRNGIIRCRLYCNYEDGKVSFEQEFKLKIQNETCQRCYRISAGYYQGIVQLRGNRMKMAKITEKLKAYLEKNGGFITKIEDVTNGFDIYVSDKQVTNNFFIQKEMKPERSYRLFGVKNGKKMYRNTYALHL